MKKHLTTSLLTLALILAGTTGALAQTKIGSVDMEKVFKNYYKTKEAESRMNEARSAVKRDLDEKVDKRKALEAEITKLNDEVKKPELSNEKRAAKNEEREKKIAVWQEQTKSLQDFAQEKEKEIASKTALIRDGIVSNIQKVISDKVKADGFDLVFDVSGKSFNNVPVVLYAKESYDFTNDVVTKLNAERPKGGASEDKPAEAAPEKPAADKKK